ncbi:hypothetical protein EJ03DRAFT_88029 [Teratosphaeria nubilosa]|uniref:Uncharacterized protein n=1 Tax=Teratosphaeria nubilosa TaxID=161662 RepID=A0A6G1LB14_9PEZI|nr:hypothetical protein EJ03DRAFT_88029 [Teratosphaeria nubilosa]
MNYCTHPAGHTRVSTTMVAPTIWNSCWRGLHSPHASIIIFTECTVATVIVHSDATRADGIGGLADSQLDQSEPPKLRLFVNCYRSSGIRLACRISVCSSAFCSPIRLVVLVRSLWVEENVIGRQMVVWRCWCESAARCNGILRSCCSAAGVAKAAPGHLTDNAITDCSAASL